MKKLIALLLAAMMVLSLAACGGKTENTPAPAETTPAPAAESTEPAAPEEPKLATVTEGKLTVATSPDFAPYEFYAVENGTPRLAGLSPDPKRESIMDFSDIYYQGGQSFVTVKGNEAMFTKLEDTNNPNYQIGAQTGSIQVDLAQENSPDADIIQLAKVTDIIAELLAGKLAGAYIETAVAESYAVNYPELAIVLDVPYDVSGSAVGVSKGNTELLNAVNEAIAQALADGSMDRFVAEANELASGEIIEGLLD